MSKKVIDIIRPGRKNEASGSADGEANRPKRRDRKKAKEKKNRRIPKFVWLALPFLVLLFVFLYLTFTGSLTIGAVIEEEPLLLSAEVEVLVGAEEIDIENRVIGGQVFVGEANEEETFSATGRFMQGERASGMLTIYNNHLPAQIISLRADTRFLSAKGSKIFRIDKGVNVPAAKKEGTGTVPGEITVKVYADKEGEDYNIEASKFSVPGLAGTVFYYNVWAESKEPLAGGLKRETKQLTEEDIKKAEEDLRNILTQEALNLIKIELPNGLAFEEEAFVEDTLKISCTEKAGALKETFNCSASIKLTGISFEMDVLKQLALILLEPEVPGTKKLNAESLKVDFAPTTVLVEQGKMIIKAEIKAEIYEPIEESILLSQVSGKSKPEIKEILERDFSQLKAVELKFSPFWLRNAPQNQERINLQLTF